MLWKWRK